MRKELEKRGFRGPEGDKGAKGGLFMHHYDCMAIGIVFSHYSLSDKTNKSGIMLLNIIYTVTRPRQSVPNSWI